jgi:hypothetical protein
MAIYQKKVSVGSFLEKGKDIKDKDIVEIASEGKEVEGKFGLQNIFLVKLADGKEGNVAMNQTSLNNFIDAWGEDSLKWIGKKALVWAILSNVQGKMTKVYYFTHPEATLSESGEFVIPGQERPAQEQEEVVNPDDIPF